MMYVKIKLSNGVKAIEHCFMKSEVEAIEINEKVNELKLKFNKNDILSLSCGY